MHRFFCLGIFILWVQSVSAQLANGSPAPDFTVNDLNGNSYNLYSMMGSNKSACIDFSATWCGPCWSFHQAGILEEVYNNLSGQTTVIFLEADFNTNTACLYGPSGCVGGTQGNWVSGTPFRMADLSSTNGPGIKSQYKINYYPTLYVISPDKRTWLIEDWSYQHYESWITGSFALNSSATITHSSCGDNGKIIMNTTGGYGIIYYQWSNGATTKDLVNIPGGTYSVRISDSNDYFEDYGPFVVNGPSKRVDVTNSNLTHINCFDEATGGIDIQVEFGTPPYSYQWSNGKISKSIASVKAGNYNLTVTDNNGCTRLKTYALNQPSDLTLMANTGKENCDNRDGFIQAKAGGGVTPYLYSIGNGNQPSPRFSDLEGGKNYVVTVIDANGCDEVVSSFVDVTHRPDAIAGPDQFYDCKKEIINLDGSQSSQGASLVIEWITQNGNIVKGSESLVPEIDRPGKYILKITDIDNQCFDKDSVNVIDVRKFPHIHATGDTLLDCQFKETEISGFSLDSGVSYYWKKMNDSVFHSMEKNILVSDSGMFIFHVRDTLNLCISRDTIQILKDQLEPVARIQSNGDLSCLNPELLLDASLSSQGAEFEYHWTTSNGNIKSGATGLKALVDQGGDYQLEVINNKNHCNTIASHFVIERTLPVSGFSQITSNLTVQFNDLSSGYPVFWFWTFGDGNSSIEKNPSHDFASGGEFEVCLTVENDCGKDQVCQKLLIGINSTLQLTGSNIRNVSCFGGNNGAIELEVTGGVPPYQFFWSNLKTSEDIEDLPAGNYTVQIKDQQGTVIIKMFEVIQPAEILIQDLNIQNTPSGAAEGRINIDLIGGVPPYSFVWSNGNTGNPLTGLQAGKYSCIVTDANSCQKEFGEFIIQEITANVNPDWVRDLSITPNPVNGLGRMHIQFVKHRESRISIKNILGQTLWTQIGNNNNIDISFDFTGYPSGLYYLIVEVSDGHALLKWLVTN